MRVHNLRISPRARTLAALTAGAFLTACAARAPKATPTPPPTATTAPSRSEPAPPTITTYLLEERRGVDTLRLVEVIRAGGYLKREPPARLSAAAVPPGHYRFSFLSAGGDTLRQATAAPGLDERMEAPGEDGGLVPLDVAHETHPIALRVTDARFATLLVERSDPSGTLAPLQRIALAEAPRKN